MKSQLCVALTLLFASLAFGTGSAQEPPCVFTVNGNLGSGSIQSNISDGVFLQISGVCNESFAVTRDDVTMIGSGTIQGQLIVAGAQRFSLGGGLTVTDTAGEGIYITDGASAKIWGATVSGYPDCGIEVRWNSFAEVVGSTIENNKRGFCINLSGALYGRENEIDSNYDNSVGVDVSQDGTYRGRNESIGQSNPATTSVSVTRNSFVDLQRGTDVTGDINAERQAHLLVRGTTTVAGNISVDLSSELDLSDDAQITGDIEARNLSIVTIGGAATVNGIVRCYSTSKCLP